MFRWKERLREDVLETDDPLEEAILVYVAENSVELTPHITVPYAADVGTIEARIAMFNYLATNHPSFTDSFIERELADAHVLWLGGKTDIERAPEFIRKKHPEGTEPLKNQELLLASALLSIAYRGPREDADLALLADILMERQDLLTPSQTEPLIYVAQELGYEFPIHHPQAAALVIRDEYRLRERDLVGPKLEQYFAPRKPS